MKKVLENLIDSNWKNSIKDVEYKIFWLKEPHCKESKSIKQTDGSIAYYCRHTNEHS